MTDLLLDECYSCVIASLHLMKSMASADAGSGRNVIEAAADLSQICIACIRSHEAGSVLPQTENRLAEECQRLVDIIQKSSTRLHEAAACSTACENLIQTYHQVV